MVWKDVKANTNAPDGLTTLCFNRLNRSWYAFKHELKEKYYLPNDTVAKRLAVVPPEVKADQWRELVRYWSMESTQALSMKNTDNLRNLLAYPGIGRKSILNIVDKRKKVYEPSDLISLWRETCSKKGKYTDGEAEFEQTLQRRLDELPEEERDDPKKRERIFLDVLIGNEGQKRVLSSGKGMRLSSSLYEALASSIRDYEAEIARLREEATVRDRRDAERDHRDKERDRCDEERDQRHHEEIAELKAQFHEQIAELKAQLQVALQSTADSKARVIRMLQSARFSMIFPSPSP